MSSHTDCLKDIERIVSVFLMQMIEFFYLLVNIAREEQVNVHFLNWFIGSR